MRFRVLGPVEAARDDTALPLGGPKQRLVLALLVVDAPRSVTTSALIDGVWDGDPPETARKTLQGYVHHLRSQVGEALVTDAVGYRLDIDPASIDAVEFEAQTKEARALAMTDPRAASGQLAEALAMWRGTPYADLDGVLALEPEIGRLSELRVGAVEDRIAADLELGADGSLIGELESLVHEYPLREGFRALLMRALHATGRQPEALRAYEAARRFLGHELGLEPSQTLQELHLRILNDDVEVARPPPAQRPTRGIRGYELRELVGDGPTATVHRAFHAGLGREVALKAYRAEVANLPALIEGFDEASRRIASLQHDHIVPLLDTWREPGAAYQVRPWLAGGSMATRWSARPPPLPTLLRTLDEIGAALSHAHHQGVVHGALKPTNVLLDADGRAALSDFPLIDAIRHSGDEYVAPEIRDGAGTPNPAADVFGLGALAHQLLTGEPPVAKVSGPDLSPRLDPVFVPPLTRACAWHPADRHGRVEELVRSLKQAAGVDVTAAAVTAEGVRRSEIRNPYKGLRSFQEVDAADFYGREALVGKLLDALEHGDFVALVGPSGIGKSSAVKAGLIPALRARRNGLGGHVLVTEMFPGSHPFEELATALLKVAVRHPAGIVDELAGDERGLLRIVKQTLPDDDSRLVLVIDQFEELFTLVADESRRRMFLACLRAAVTDERSRVQVIITMRADFFDRPLEYHEFGQLLDAGAVTVLAPAEEELRQAIAAPARQVGLDLEPGLVGEIVRDVSGQPGGLPLMQYALTELFDRRTSDVLTIAAYRETGGVLGALGAKAEELWQSLSPSGRAAIRQTFLRLVVVDDTSDDMRRRVRRSELAAMDIPHRELADAITLFGAHRLLTFDRDPVTRGPTVEVAHEALLREWDRLRGWIETQREELVLHRLLATELSEWESADRDPSYLLRGGRLEQFEAWERSTEISLTTPEREFLDTSRALREEEREKERSTRLRLRRMLVGVSILAVAAALAGVFAFFQWGDARDNAAAEAVARDVAETRRIALQAPQLMDTNRQVALLLAVEAFHRNPDDPVTLGALQDAFVRAGNFLGYVVPESNAHAIGFTSVGDLVAVTAEGIAVFDSDTGHRSRLTAVDGIEDATVSASSNRAAVIHGAEVVVYDVLSQAEIRRIDVGVDSDVTALEFDRSGGMIGVGFLDGSASVVDLESGGVATFMAHPERELEGFVVPPHLPDAAQFGTRVLAISDDGTRVATGGLAHARVWELADTTSAVYETVLMRRAPDGSRIAEGVRALRFSPESSDEVHVASSINVATLDVVAGTQTEFGEFPDRVDAIVNNTLEEAVALTDTAAILAFSGGRVVVLPLDGAPPIQFDSHTPGRPDVGLTADGLTVAVQNDDQISLWALGGERLAALSVPRGRVTEAVLSGDGEWLVLQAPIGLDILLYQRTEHGYQLVDLGVEGLQSGHPGPTGMVTWNRIDSAPTEYWDLTESPPTRRVLQEERSIYAYAFSHDGRLFAAGASSETSPAGSVVQVFDVTTGEAVTEPLLELVVETPPELAAIGVDLRSAVQSLSFSADGTRLVGVNSDGKAVIWDLESGSHVVLAHGGNQVVLAEYSPDGRYLATIAADGTTLLRDPDTLEQRMRLIGQTSGDEGLTIGPAFTEDGRYLITTADSTGRVWDLEAQAQVGTGFPALPNSGTNASRDGRWLVTLDEDVVLVWDLDFARWPDLACRAAGRNLTPVEWQQFAPPGEAYQTTCDMWPSLEDQDE